MLKQAPKPWVETRKWEGFCNELMHVLSFRPSVLCQEGTVLNKTWSQICTTAVTGETPPINHYRGCVQDISNKINTFAGVWSCWKRKAILECILQTGNTLFLGEKQEYRGSQRSEGIKTVLSTLSVSMHALADAMGFSMEFVRKSKCIIWCGWRGSDCVERTGMERWEEGKTAASHEH